MRWIVSTGGGDVLKLKESKAQAWSEELADLKEEFRPGMKLRRSIGMRG